MSIYLVKILSVVLLSSVKFLIAIPYSIAVMQFSFLETVIFSIIGGILGVLVFGLLSKQVYRVIDIILYPFRSKKKQKKPSENKLAERIGKKYGLTLLAIITPSIISIPVGTLIALKLFPNKRRTISFLIISVILWSLLLSIGSEHLIYYFGYNN